MIEDVIACVGSVPDRSGAEGIDQDLLDGFFAEATAYSEWWRRPADAANVRLLVMQLNRRRRSTRRSGQDQRLLHARFRLVAFDAKAESFLNPVRRIPRWRT